ncbi:MAG TPA: hypothetical protein ENJ31_07475 [Anaerolineae bacterium]|nr:hypothetical protein [Anaerolineae bacterium]
MSLEDVGKFWEWVRREAYSRGWSVRELERRAEFAYGRINNAANLGRTPTIEVCLGIAKAFGLSPIDVQRKAGLLPPLPESRRQDIERIAEILDSLPDGPIREQTIEAIRMIVEGAKRRVLEQQEENIDTDTA